MCLLIFILIALLIHKLKHILYTKNYVVIFVYTGTYILKMIVYSYYFWVVTDQGNAEVMVSTNTTGNELL